MTMAAGMVAADGILLFADTLYTDGMTKDYRDKIFTWEADCAAACFAIAGNAAIARMSVDECCDGLASATETPTIQEMLAVIRPILKRVYEEYVDTRPAEERVYADFWLVIALSTSSEGSRLYSSVRTAIASVDYFECIGSGRQLGRYVIEPAYHPDITVAEAETLAINALAAAKERVDGVDGRSQFILVKDGGASRLEAKNGALWEKCAIDFRQASTRLFLDLCNSSLGDDAFSESLAEFCKESQSIRRFWNGSALDFIANKFNDYMKTGRVPSRVAQPDPAPTTGDPSHSLPSQE